MFAGKRSPELTARRVPAKGERVVLQFPNTCLFVLLLFV